MCAIILCAIRGLQQRRRALAGGPERHSLAASFALVALVALLPAPPEPWYAHTKGPVGRQRATTAAQACFLRARALCALPLLAAGCWLLAAALACLLACLRLACALLFLMMMMMLLMMLPGWP